MKKNTRRWLELRVRCPVAGNDREVLLADGLIHLGASGVEEQSGWYVSYFDEPDDPSGFVSTSISVLSNATGLSSIEVDIDGSCTRTGKKAGGRAWAAGLLIIVVFPSWAPPENHN